MPLNDDTVRNAEADTKAIRIFDGDGLYTGSIPGRGQAVALEIPHMGWRKTSFGQDAGCVQSAQTGHPLCLNSLTKVINFRISAR